MKKYIGKIKNNISQYFTRSTIIVVDVLYFLSDNKSYRYKGKVMLPRKKYFKEMLHNHFDEEKTKVLIIEKDGNSLYVSDSKMPLHEMIRISLEIKLGKKINAISVFKAHTI